VLVSDRVGLETWVYLFEQSVFMRCCSVYFNVNITGLLTDWEG
jgi:hypothetical protein